MLPHTLVTLVCLFGAVTDATPLPYSFWNAKKPSAYVVVGDSLSDNGNTWKLSNYVWPEVRTLDSGKNSREHPDGAVLRDYDMGRFTNGHVWVEYLIAGTCEVLHDFAYAGATTSNSLIPGFSGNFSVPNNAAVFSVPSAQDQITTSVTPLVNYIDLKRSIFFLWIGANDYIFNFFNNGTLAPAQVSGQIFDRVDELLALGAQTILVFNLPPIDAIPAINADKTGQSQEYFKNILMEHNNALQDRETNVWSQLEAAKVSVFDVHALISEYLANPELYGLDNVVDNCADDSTGMVGASACENPDKYLWWDKYHPTTNVQKSMSHAVKVAVEALQ